MLRDCWLTCRSVAWGGSSERITIGSKLYYAAKRTFVAATTLEQCTIEPITEQSCHHNALALGVLTSVLLTGTTSQSWSPGNTIFVSLALPELREVVSTI